MGNQYLGKRVSIFQIISFHFYCLNYEKPFHNLEYMASLQKKELTKPDKKSDQTSNKISSLLYKDITSLYFDVVILKLNIFFAFSDKC